MKKRPIFPHAETEMSSLRKTMEDIRKKPPLNKGEVSFVKWLVKHEKELKKIIGDASIK